MRTYTPTFAGDADTRREFEQIKKAAMRADQLLALDYITVAPTKPQDGLYLAAAGVLGVSRGLYRYDSSTGLYTFLG